MAFSTSLPGCLRGMLVSWRWPSAKLPGSSTRSTHRAACAPSSCRTALPCTSLACRLAIVPLVRIILHMLPHVRKTGVSPRHAQPALLPACRMVMHVDALPVRVAVHRLPGLQHGQGWALQPRRGLSCALPFGCRWVRHWCWSAQRSPAWRDSSSTWPGSWRVRCGRAPGLAWPRARRAPSLATHNQRPAAPETCPAGRAPARAVRYTHHLARLL